jgi:Putative porin
MVSLQAQRPTIGRNGSGGSSSLPNNLPSMPQSDEADLDTVKINYFYAAQPSVKIPFKDTLLTNDFQQYIPMKSRRAEYAYLGLSGSPNHPIVWQPTIREGFDVGIHTFDVFMSNNDALKYYATSKPFSQAKWTVRSIGDDSNFDFDFGGQYANNYFASINWHKINQSSVPNYSFGGASTRNANWTIGTGHIGKRYSAFASFSNNNFEQTHHGGIKGFQKNFIFNNNVPVYLGGTNGKLNLRYRLQNIQYRQTYQLNAQSDSLGKRNYLITHQFDFQTISNKNYASTQSNDSTGKAFYQSLYNDTRGVRVFFEIKKIQNQISIATQKPRAGQAPDGIEIGLKHSFYAIHFEPKDSNVQNLFAFGKWDFALSKWLKVNTYAHFGLLASNFAEYCAKGDLQLNLQQLGQLEVNFLQQRYQPSWLQSRMYSFQKAVWENNDLKKTFSTTLSGTYRLPKYNFSVTGSYHLLNNYIYFGQNLLPTQASSAVNLLQLEILKDFHFHKIHLENYFALQKSSSSTLNLPTFFGKNGLYLEGKIFRKGAMLARIGADVRYTSSYFADAYHPLINQFYTQNAVEIPIFPAIDVYISARVLKFRAFVKMENITASAANNKVFYQVPNYPMYGRYLRLGFYRRFTD